MKEAADRKLFLKSDDEPHSMPHLDEKWLVSYSDMMTLLFGLFVILFALASEKNGNFQESLKTMSHEGFERKPQSHLQISEAEYKLKVEELRKANVKITNMENSLKILEEKYKIEMQKVKDLEVSLSQAIEDMKAPVMVQIEWNPNQNFITFINDDQRRVMLPCKPTSQNARCATKFGVVKVNKQ
jgi:chemotaxis protein MotB